MSGARNPSVLLLGYGGANNTGADVRVLSIIDDLRSVFGSHVNLTVGTLSREKTLRSIKEGDSLKVVQIPYVFPFFIWKLVSRHDVIMLVEGSTFKDNWSSVLLYLFLWGAWSATRQGKAAIAYAVEAGRMRPLNRWLTQKVCRSMDMIITRTADSRRELRELGVQSPIHVTTDTAFQFRQAPAMRQASTLLGCAPMEFNEWPVRVRLVGPREQCYHWPYYFTWNRERALLSDGLVSIWSELIVHSVRIRHWRVCLIAMEELDQRICEKIYNLLPEDVRSSVTRCYAGFEKADDIVAKLRSLDYLVTSRYHACVLSMESAVPQVSFYHDERLINIYREMGMESLAVSGSEENARERLMGCVQSMVNEREVISESIKNSVASFFMPKCRENRVLLREWWNSVSVKRLMS